MGVYHGSIGRWYKLEASFATFPVADGNGYVCDSTYSKICGPLPTIFAGIGVNSSVEWTVSRVERAGPHPAFSATMLTHFSRSLASQ